MLGKAPGLDFAVQDIQEALLSQWTGMSDAEVIQKIKRDLHTSDSPVAVWWRQNIFRCRCAHAAEYC